MLRRFLKGFRKVLNEKGYTLIEVAAVVAITATLAAVVVPVAMDKIKTSKEATASDGAKALASAVAGFYADTGVWPAHSGTTADYLYVLRVGSTGTSALGTAGDGDPSLGSADGWTATGGFTDYAHRHLVVNDPGGGDTNYSSSWKGPYAESLTGVGKRDPWGYNYLIWVKGMRTTDGSSYGWIISAGPDGIVQTDATADKLAGDDIGLSLYKKN